MFLIDLDDDVEWPTEVCWLVLYCIPRVTLMDAYSTDYYDISYPGLIMKVNKIS